MIFRIQYISYYIYVFIYILPSIYRPWRAVSSDSALIFRSQPVFFPCLQYLHFIKIRISHKFTKSDCYMQFTNRLRLRQGWDTFPTLLPPTSLCFFRNIPCPLPHQWLKSHRLNTLSYRAFESFLFAYKYVLRSERERESSSLFFSLLAHSGLVTVPEQQHEIQFKPQL